MDIWRLDKLVIFLLFFVPGFVSLRTYDMLIAGPRRDFTKAIIDAVGYSALNYAVLSGLIAFVPWQFLFASHRFSFALLFALIAFVCPAFWPVLLIKLSNSKLAKCFVHPVAKPWDFVFSGKPAFWVTIHLMDGRKIGGRFQSKSFASSYPEEEQLFLEEAWEIQPDGQFVQPIAQSAGVLVFGRNIAAVDFYNDEGGINDE